MLNLTEYNRKELPNWCTGCGNFSMLAGIKKSLAELEIAPHQVVVVSGVGCFAKLPYWLRTYGFVGLHGRSLPVAQGIKLANHRLKVIALGGDGDGYGEGGNHFLHACRRNIDIAYFVHNNGVFGLTTGQYSPSSARGTKTKSSPGGSSEVPINPLALAIAEGATFVARAYAGNPKEMIEIMKKSIEHKGFSFVDIIQPCVTFGHNYQYYNDRVYYLTETYHHRGQAMEKALEYEKENKFAVGIFYQER